MNGWTAVTNLVNGLTADEPELAAHVAALQQFLLNGGDVVDEHRFAVVMSLASRVVAYMPHADHVLAQCVGNLRLRDIRPADAATATLIQRAEEQRVSDLAMAREAEPQKWAAAVKFLRGWLSPSVQQQVREVINSKSPDWPAGYHMGWGMGVRNGLREAGYGEKEFGVLDLDNIYVELVEEAVQS